MFKLKIYEQNLENLSIIVDGTAVKTFGLKYGNNDQILFGVSFWRHPICIYSMCIYTVSGKKSLQYFMCNFIKFEVIFIIFGTNHPETPLY